MVPHDLSLIAGCSRPRQSEGVSQVRCVSRLANTSEPISPRRHPGDWGRFVAGSEAYRNRTGNGQIRRLLGDMGRFGQPSRLVADALAKDS